MRRGRRLPLLELSQEQRTTLQGWTRRRTTAQALSMRSMSRSQLKVRERQ